MFGVAIGAQPLNTQWIFVVVVMAVESMRWWR